MYGEREGRVCRRNWWYVVAFAECRGLVHGQALVDRTPSHARGNKVGERK
jgi:hypothetical protein